MEQDNSPPSDQQVTSKAILNAVMALRRCSTKEALQHLEQVEPDLASYLMESLSQIHHRILRLGGPAKPSQRLYHQVQSLALVCIAALRQGHYELWRDATAGSQLEALDPEADEQANASPDDPSGDTDL